mgnify:CR=1 FL=1
MKPLHILPLALSLVIVTACSTAPTEPTEPSPYPVVNVSPYYEVDAAWPKRPTGVPWSDMPGVAIDADGNVWCYTRTQPAIQVYSPTGELVKSWATEEESTAHQIKIDKDGNVFAAFYNVSRFCFKTGNSVFFLQS